MIPYLRASHQGQVLIVTAVALVVLISIGAIVVDLGFSWMLRRQEQNAADPAAIAAARWLKDPTTGNPNNPLTIQGSMNTDACFYAQQNGFFTTDAGCSAALASGDLLVKSPPISGPYSSRDGFVQVMISSTHPSFFGRIFGQTTAVVTTDAIAANTAGNSNSSSLVALKDDGCGGGSAGNVNGGGTVRIFPAGGATNGGYVHVNQMCGSSADNICNNGVGNSSLSISGTLVAPFAYVGGSCVFNGSGANGLQCPTGVSTCLQEQALPLGDPLAGLPEPQLSDFPNGHCPDGTISTPASISACQLKNGASICPSGICHLTPGVYYGGFDVKSNVTVQLDPGMYILAGGGIKLSGSSSIDAISSPSGIEARITIFSTDGPGCPSISVQCQGSITFTANQSFQAKATNAATCALVTPNACPWKGILLWQDGSASNPTATVKLGGQASSILAGTIYAPKADVQIAGGTNTTGCGGVSAGCLSIQLISWTWTITGGGTVDMPYDPRELYQLDQRGLVH